MYAFCQLIPRRFPSSIPGTFLILRAATRYRQRSRAARLRRTLLAHPLAEYFRLRDSWAVFTDGGSEEAYWTWRRKFDVTRTPDASKLKQQ